MKLLPLLDECAEGQHSRCAIALDPRRFSGCDCVCHRLLAAIGKTYPGLERDERMVALNAVQSLFRIQGILSGKSDPVKSARIGEAIRVLLDEPPVLAPKA